MTDLVRRALLGDAKAAKECMTQEYTCGQCSNFIGGGDWGLCCQVTYDLCYDDAKSCEFFKPKEAKE